MTCICFLCWLKNWRLACKRQGRQDANASRVSEFVLWHAVCCGDLNGSGSGSATTWIRLCDTNGGLKHGRWKTKARTLGCTLVCVLCPAGLYASIGVERPGSTLPWRGQVWHLSLNDKVKCKHWGNKSRLRDDGTNMERAACETETVATIHVACAIDRTHCEREHISSRDRPGERHRRDGDTSGNESGADNGWLPCALRRPIPPQYTNCVNKEYQALSSWESHGRKVPPSTHTAEALNVQHLEWTCVAPKCGILYCGRLCMGSLNMGQCHANLTDEARQQNTKTTAYTQGPGKIRRPSSNANASEATKSWWFDTRCSRGFPWSWGHGLDTLDTEYLLPPWMKYLTTKTPAVQKETSTGADAPVAPRRCDTRWSAPDPATWHG